MRLKRHPEQRSSLSKVVITGGLLVLAFIALASALVFFTDICRIRQVNVTGTKNLTVEYVRDLSGVDSYENLATLPVGAIRKNLLKDPWIREARIGRKPLHTVDIGITERDPVAMLVNGETGYLADKDARVFARTNLQEHERLPRIDANTLPVPILDHVVSDAKVKNSIELLDGMSENLRSMIAEACPFDERGVVFKAKGGFEVIYGPADDIKRKNEVLEAMMLDIQNNERSLEYLDIRVPDCPVIKAN